MAKVDDTMTFISEAKKKVIINTTAEVLNETANENPHVATVTFNQDTGLVAAFRTMENGIQPPNASTIETPTILIPQVHQAADAKSNMSSIGTNGTLATRVSTIETNIKSLTDMLSGYIASQHNANGDKERFPLSYVVTPSTAPAVEGPAL